MMQNSSAEIHVGNILLRYFNEKRIRKAALSRISGIKVATIIRHLKSENASVQFLIQISKAVQYNFLAEIALQMPPSLVQPTNPDNISHATEIQTLKAEISRLQTENDLMKLLLTSQKA